MPADRTTPLETVPASHLVPGLILLLACAAAQADPNAGGDSDTRGAHLASPATSVTAAAGASSPRLPDLHGALIVSSTYRYYVSILYGTEAEARRSALASCKEDEPHATCAVYASFKNQCIAVAANGAQHVVAIGKEEWDQQQTRDFGLRRCQQATGSACRSVITACSTQAQKAEDQRASAGAEKPASTDLPGYVAARVRRDDR